MQHVFNNISFLWVQNNFSKLQFVCGQEYKTIFTFTFHLILFCYIDIDEDEDEEDEDEDDSDDDYQFDIYLPDVTERKVQKMFPVDSPQNKHSQIRKYLLTKVVY